jgi:hypothetical protein
VDGAPVDVVDRAWPASAEAERAEAAPAALPREKAVNQSHARIRALGERAIAALKTWRLLNTPALNARRAP